MRLEFQNLHFLYLSMDFRRAALLGLTSRPIRRYAFIGKFEFITFRPHALLGAACRSAVFRLRPPDRAPDRDCNTAAMM